MCIVLAGACALYHSLAFASIFFPLNKHFAFDKKYKSTATGEPNGFSSVKQLSSHMSLGISRAVILSLWFRFRTSYVSLDNNKLPPLLLLLLLPDGIKMTAGHHEDMWTRQIVSRRDGWCGIDRPRSVWHSTVPIQICQSCCNWFAFLNCAFNMIRSVVIISQIILSAIMICAQGFTVSWEKKTFQHENNGWETVNCSCQSSFIANYVKILWEINIVLTTVYLEIVHT